jgi:hypothetical protein
LTINADCTIRAGQSIYAKWTIFVYQVATFVGIGVREGLGHRGGGRAKGQSPVAWELRPHDRSRCASTEVLQVQIGMVCASHRG